MSLKDMNKEQREGVTKLMKNKNALYLKNYIKDKMEELDSNSDIPDRIMHNKEALGFETRARRLALVKLTKIMKGLLDAEEFDIMKTKGSIDDYLMELPDKNKKDKKGDKDKN